MALGRLSGADVSIYKIFSFTDLKSTDTAMPYIEWAINKKINVRKAKRKCNKKRGFQPFW